MWKKTDIANDFKEWRGNTFWFQASMSILDVMESEENNKNPHLKNSEPFQSLFQS